MWICICVKRVIRIIIDLDLDHSRSYDRVLGPVAARRVRQHAAWGWWSLEFPPAFCLCTGLEQMDA